MLMQALIISTSHFFIAAFVFLSGVAAAMWRAKASQSIDSGSAVSHLLGPLGALALALLAIYVLVKYLQRKEKQLEEIQRQFLEDAIKEKEYWREQARKNSE